jgi:hypothetical protein
MSTLFEITDEFKELYELGADPDVDSEVWEDTLEALTGELEVKGTGYVNVIKQLEMEAKQAAEISKMFANKQKVRENHIKQMKDALKLAMEKIGTDEIDAGIFKIKLQTNGGVQPLVIDGDIPQNMQKITISPDNDKIRQFLKNNSCEWAHLEERGKHIVIK